MKATKKCAECGRELPIEDFNKNKRNRDGLQDRCRECFSKYNKARYAANPERFKADVAAYRANNPKTHMETRLRACAKNPTRINANRAVEAALKAGAIENPGVCYGCGCKAGEHRIEAHHHDYSKPLDVVWLCTPCHRRMDAQRRIREGSEPYGRRKAV